MLRTLAAKRWWIFGLVIAGLAFPGVASAQAKASQPSGLLFNGAQKSAWIDQSAAANRVQQVKDPAGGNETALKFTAYNTDVYPLTPTDNPRAQLITPSNILQSGKQYWESYEVYLPTSFPTVTSWVQLGEPVYGEPFNGSPPLALDADNEGFTNDPAGEFRWMAGPYENYEVLWASPIVKGQWVRVTWNFDVAANGFADLYVNNKEVAAEKPYTVLDGTNNQGPWYSVINVYYALNEFPSATAYYKNFAIGTTQSSATIN